MIVTLCQTCVLGRAGFAAPLREALAAAGHEAQLRLTYCMSGCSRPSTVAFRAEGKTAYLFAGVTEDDLEGLVAFAGFYAAAPDGILIDARPLGPLRFKLLARIPA